MAGLLEYKCPCCGGAIAFDPDLQKLKCPYCDTEFDVETLQDYDKELQKDKNDNMSWQSPAGGEWQEGEQEGMRVYVCASCGGSIIGDENTAATSCPYCGNPVVMKGNLAGALKPDFVIPFKFDKEAAKEGLKSHLKGKHFLPKVFKDENHIDEIKGIYVPFWLFDTDADADLRYKATRVRSWSDSDYNYTETSHYSVIRAGTLGFNHVPVDGSSKMPDELMESLEPFDFSQAVDFQTAYLAGYFADKYDVTSEMSVQRANERIKTATEQAFAATVTGYSSVLKDGGSISLRNSKASYALYPVWLLNTTWKGEKYTFAMNGQTGKFVGNLPMDKSAYRRTLWGLAAAIAAGVFLLTYLLWLI